MNEVRAALSAAQWSTLIALILEIVLISVKVKTPVFENRQQIYRSEALSYFLHPISILFVLQLTDHLAQNEDLEFGFVRFVYYIWVCKLCRVILYAIAYIRSSLFLLNNKLLNLNSH